MYRLTCVLNWSDLQEIHLCLNFNLSKISVYMMILFICVKCFNRDNIVTDNIIWLLIINSPLPLFRLLILISISRRSSVTHVVFPEIKEFFSWFILISLIMKAASKRKWLNLGLHVVKLKSSLRKFCRCLCELVDQLCYRLPRIKSFLRIDDEIYLRHCAYHDKHNGRH